MEKGTWQRTTESPLTREVCSRTHGTREGCSSLLWTAGTAMFWICCVVRGKGQSVVPARNATTRIGILRVSAL